MKKLKRIVSMVLSCAMIFSLVACGSGDSVDNSSESGGSTGTGSTNTSVVIGYQSDITDMCPWATANFTNCLDQIYETLVTFDENDEITGCLAESWDVSDDGMTYTFHIREGVTFQNGDPLTAEDVVYSEMMLMNNTVMSALTYGMKDWEVVDENTAQLNMTLPYAQEATLSMLALVCFGVADKSVVEEYEYSWPNDLSGAGTGAYKVASFDAGDALVLEAYDGYWGGAPDVKKCTYKIITDASSAAIAIENGEIDFYAYPSSLDVPNLEANSSISIDEKDVVGDVSIICNLTEANGDSPINNKLVRQAINLALDRDSLLLLSTDGEGYGTSTFFAPSLNGYDSSFEVKQDQEKAKELLKEAGYENGLNLTLSYIEGLHFTVQPLAEGIQSQLGEIGITVSIEPKDMSSGIEALYSGTFGDMTLNVIYTCVIDPFYALYCNVSSEALGSSNCSGYGNSELDELINEGRRENDADKQAEYISQIQTIMDEEVPVLPLINGGINRSVYNSDRLDNVHIDWEKYWRVKNWKLK
jgi:peptide/nickel transport system substrate-binding protein